MSTKNRTKNQTSVIKFSLLSLKKRLRRLLPKNGIKKPLIGNLKTSSKLLRAGVLMGAGAELASHVSSKAQGVVDWTGTNTSSWRILGRPS